MPCLHPQHHWGIFRKLLGPLWLWKHLHQSSNMVDWFKNLNHISEIDGFISTKPNQHIGLAIYLARCDYPKICTSSSLGTHLPRLQGAKTVDVGSVGTAKDQGYDRWGQMEQ